MAGAGGTRALFWGRTWMLRLCAGRILQPELRSSSFRPGSESPLRPSAIRLCSHWRWPIRLGRIRLRTRLRPTGGSTRPSCVRARRVSKASRKTRGSLTGMQVRELTVGLVVLLVSPGIALRAGHARTDSRCPGTRTCRRSAGFGTAGGTRSLPLLQLVQSPVWWAESESESRRRSVGRWQSLPSLDLAFPALVSRSSWLPWL